MIIDFGTMLPSNKAPGGLFEGAIICKHEFLGGGLFQGGGLIGGGGLIQRLTV